MEVLKIKLTQKTANYKIPETIKNRTTYPLPPLSTIIGAIHNACGWNTYHDMNIGIIGKYDSLTTDFKRINYTDKVLLDRETLIKSQNGLYNNFCSAKICKSVTSQGNLKDENQTIYFDKDEFYKYVDLKEKYDKKDDERKIIEKKIKNTQKEKRKNKKNIDKYNELELEEKTLTSDLENIKELINDMNDELSKYYLQHTEVCHYQILNNVELILYISSSKENLREIEENLYNLTAIGRSEDFVDIIDSQIIELKEDIDKCYRNESTWNSYIDVDLIKNDDVIINVRNRTALQNGTVYRIQKDYHIENGKRVFNKKKVVYTSNFKVEESCKNVYIDDTEQNKIFIVNLL